MNNYKYPVYYKTAPEELQQCGFININAGLYGEAYVSCEDHNGCRISPIYELNRRGIKKTDQL